GILPIELADRVVAEHHRLWKTLNISNDDFIRTTEGRHRIGVYELIKRIQERMPDDIYLGSHSGWYCQSEETFIPDNQVKDKKDESGHPVEQTTETNYFFKLSRYTEPLLRHYRDNPGFLYPQTRLNEVVAFVEQGLKDLSISRTSVKWGIPFPGNPDHVIYVWMDALTNYISALGFGEGQHARFDQYWPADIHLVGKDIVRFHAVYWPAFLMSAGLPLPKRVVGHGWWLRDNQKISKSLGNIVRPNEIIDRFGTDPFRYFVMRDMVFGQDQNYSDESFITRYNGDLAKGLGNALSRTLKMAETYFEGRTPPVPCNDNELKTTAEQIIPEYLKAMDELAFHRALESAWRLVSAVDRYIVTREPWKHFKEKGADEALSRVLWNCLEALRIVCVMIAPVMPATASNALTRIGDGPEAIGSDALQWGRLANGATLRGGDGLFPVIDAAKYLEKNMDEITPPLETTQAESPDVAKISIDQFMQTDLRVGEVRSAERVPKSKKLIRMMIFTGDGERQIVAGIGTKYTPEELVGRKVIIVANLQPATLMGVESNGMVLAASIDGEPSLLSVDP